MTANPRKYTEKDTFQPNTSSWPAAKVAAALPRPDMPPFRPIMVLRV